MSNFLRILSYVKPFKRLAILNIIFNLLTILFSVVSFLMVIPLLELLFDIKTPVDTQPVFEQFGLMAKHKYVIEYFYYLMGHYMNQFGKQAALIFICIVVVVVFSLKNTFRYLALYFMAPIRNGVVRNIRQNLYDKLLALPQAYFGKERKGDIITRITTDVKEVEYSILSTIEATFKAPLTIMVNLIVMLLISKELTFFIFIMILLTALVIGQIGKRLKKVSTDVQEKQSLITSIVEETLTGLRIIKAFNAEDYMKKQFGDENQAFYRIMNRMLYRRDLSSPLTEFLVICIAAIILWFGGGIVLKGELEPQLFIGFIVIFSQLIAPSKSFASAFYNIQKGLASSQRIDEVLDEQQKIPEIDNPRPFKSFEDKIEFRNVSFAYHNYDDKLILKDINIAINKGEMIALVGQSGAGKTTMVDLLPRFYDVEQGEILIDGISIKEYSLSDLRKLLGIVTQQSILFNDSVYNNIAFGRPDASREAVIEAAKVANAHDFIMGFEKGYDTNIGDAGNLLSGGERQRLTIARAVLKNPPILILDEATSSLDSESEKLVQDALIKLMKNRTSIVIAHRLSTIQYADEILVLQEGEVAERGNHISLMARNGLYKKLVELQQF